MIGATPCTGWLDGMVALDSKGFVRTGPEAASGNTGQFQTSVPGIYAVGDVRSGNVKRVASGVGEGSVAISNLYAYLNAPKT